MQQMTRNAICALLASDGTVTEKQKADAMSALDGRDAATIKPYTRKEAAEVLGCHPNSVSNYADAGIIRRIAGPKAKTCRGIGFCRADVDALARGELTAPQVEKNLGRHKRAA